MENKRTEYELLFDIINYLIRNNKIKEEIFTICEKALNIEPMKVNGVKETLSQVIHVGDYVISLNDEIISAYEKIPYFLAHFETLKKMEVEDILIKIEQYASKCKNIDEFNQHYIYVLSMLLAIDYKTNNFDEKYYISHFLYSMINYNKNMQAILNMNESILDEFKDNKINSICNNEYLLTLYNLNDIFTLKDLINSNLIYRMIIITYDEIKSHKLLEIYSLSKKERLSEEFSNLLLKLTPREEKCFREKYGIDDGEFKTLEYVGNLYNVTRERIRQIISKCEARLYNRLKPEYLYFKYLYETFKNDQKFIFCQDNISYFANDSVRRMFLAVLDILKICNVKYSLNLAYDFDITYEEIIDEIIDSKPRIIPVDEYNEEPNYMKYILSQGYDFTGEVYFKKGRNIGIVLNEILDHHFNRIIDLKSNDFQIIKELFKKEYYIDISTMQDHAFKSTIHRLGYRPIGQSKFKHQDDFVLIPSELMINIISYLNDINSPILYSVLYEHFEQELSSIGVDNSEYFKSIIDPKIKYDFNISKSYINPKDVTKSAVELAISVIRSFDGIFDFQDMKEKLPHYSDISLNIFVSKEFDNGLIALNNKNYIYSKNVEIKNEIKNELKRMIEALLNENEGIISSNNLYLYIYYNKEELLKELGIFSKSFNLFSLCKELFKNDFNFKRPLIFRKEIETMSVYDIIVNKLSNHKEISFDDIKHENLNLGTTRTGYNRIQISELVSDNFMIVDENKFINREFYQIDSSTLADIKIMLNLIIKRQKEIDTRKFKGYSLLPRFKYSWNKYSLLGVVHCYLNEEYEIINQSDSRSIEFIVRRLINE